MAVTNSAITSFPKSNTAIKIKIDPTKKLQLFLAKNGYIEANKLCKTLQGSIWLAKDKLSHKRVAIKVANRELVNRSTARYKGKEMKISEDIKSEALVLKYVSSHSKCPNSITKYVNFFKSRSAYYLVMEDGGNSLFKFVHSAHKLIKAGRLNVAEWHKLVKIMFKQMIECIEYLHLLNICHMDISLENFLISDVQITTYKDSKGKEKISFTELEKVQVKLCDFGLASVFAEGPRIKCRSNKLAGKKNYMSPEIVNRKTGFDAKKNDIWCMGICFFMMIIGGGPVHFASSKDICFVMIMNNQYMKLMKIWHRINYVNDDILDIFRMIFKMENDRAGIEDIKRCSWLKN